MMSNQVKLTSVEFIDITVNYHTRWTMAKFLDSEGISSLVELTISNAEKTLATCKIISEALHHLKNRCVVNEADIPKLLNVPLNVLQSDLIKATAISCLRSAIFQNQSTQKGLTLTEALGGKLTESIQLYANINRSMSDNRSPEAFASMASWAVDNGFEIIKCAPFDEVTASKSSKEIVEMAALGVKRVSTIRDTVGDNIRILVDCHSRFDETSAIIISKELSEVGVEWFEEPINPKSCTEVQKRIASSSPIPISGGELLYGRNSFNKLVSNESLMTIMPDVKHCGGIKEAVTIGRSAIKAGRNYSLHSPSGPVSLLASAHATAAVGGHSALEHAVKEVDWRYLLLTPLEKIQQGRLWLPKSAGLGADLNSEIVSKYGSVLVL